MIGNAIGWYFKQRHQELWDMSAVAIKNQKQLFEYFIQKLSLTEYGRIHGAHPRMTYEEFAQNLPLAGYEELKPYILRTMEGQQGLIWPSDITWFAKSSGTTSNEAKFIPITFECLENTHFKGSKEPVTQYYHFNPKANIFNGKALLIGGSNRITSDYPNCFVGDLSAILMTHMPTWANWKSAPDLSVLVMDNWEEKVERMAETTMHENISSIHGVPTWTQVVIQRVLELSGKSHIHEVWPNLELFVHGGMNFDPYREIFKKLAPDPKMNYVETYNASEGFIGVQAYKDRTDLLLTTNHGIFYEFYDASNGPESIVPLWEVKKGVNYAIVVTNNSGLWRYAIGDTITFTETPMEGGKYFLFKFSGRTKLFINAFGEEIIMENAESAVTQTCQKLNLELVDYTGAPRFEFGSEGHEWIFEFKSNPQSLDEFIDIFDQELMKVNSDYLGKRKGNLVMKRPTVHLATPQTFKRWLQSKGKLGGQNKVPRLANHRNILEEILPFM